jgi:lipoprotein signal peptidase
MKIFQYEMKKLLLNKNRLILLAVLFLIYILVAWLSSKGQFELSGKEGKQAISEYTSLMAEHTGKLDQEQLAKSQEARDKAIAEHGTGEELNMKINRDPVLKFNMRYAQFGQKVNEYWNGPAEQNKADLRGVYPLQEKLKELKASGQTDSFEYKKYSSRLDTELSIGEPVFENAVFWNCFFIRFDGFMIVFLLLLVLTYFISPLFTQEVRTEMDSIVLSTVKGRKEIVTAKLFTAAVSGAVVTAVYLVGSFIGTFIGYSDLSGMNATLRSMDGFDSSMLQLSAGGTALLGSLWLIFAAITLSLALAYISSKMKSQSAAFGLGMVILLAGSMSNYFSNEIKELIWPVVDFNFGSLAMFNVIFGQSKIYNLFGMPLSYAMAAFVVSLILCAAAILLTYLVQKKRTVV